MHHSFRFVTSCPSLSLLFHPLQNGWDGYSGEADIEITNIYIASWNDYNGFSYPGWANIPSVGRSSDGVTEYRALLRFGGVAAALPLGAVVSKATLSLTFRQYSSGFAFAARYLKPGVSAKRSGIGRDYCTKLVYAAG